MKLADALRLLRDPLDPAAPSFRVSLVSGFTPLHLETFLHASLRTLNPGCRFIVSTGQYGDCLGNLESVPSQSLEATAVVLEWSDFDARLGVRQLGGWGPSELSDILVTMDAKATRFETAIRQAAGKVPLAVCLPTLPIPPIEHNTGWQQGTLSLQLMERVASFANCIGAINRVRVVNPQRLGLGSPMGDRFDIRSELAAGFPYRLPHASSVGEHLARLICPPQPKKGLITDLDNTLWSGIVGEVGSRLVAWDLHHNAHIHGLYQQLLNSLADAGVLLAAASKNDTTIVSQALQRSDLILNQGKLFPVEAHWGDKSTSVARILDAWNIDADSVVFVDDNPMELAEVQAAYPSLRCLHFPSSDEVATFALFEELRDLFGKEHISDEDSLRHSSLRSQINVRPRDDAPLRSNDDFLRDMQAQMVLTFDKDSANGRALELINKTNQFNLNGRRYTEARWLSYLQMPKSVVLTASYKDKFGPLGTIAVLAGTQDGDSLWVDSWVMSCRAFSRRIEHCCLRALFEHLAVEEVVFDFEATARNRPVREFLEQCLGKPPSPSARLAATHFYQRCPSLFQSVTIAKHEYSV